jgi:arylsulfatase A-like enzyme
MRFLFLSLLLTLHASAAQKPNVIFILADDLGWSDTTLYGTTKFYQTPHIARLAKRGVTFTRAYSASPQIRHAIPNQTDFAAFTDRERREFKRAYQAGVSFADAQVGRITPPHKLSGQSLRPALEDPGHPGKEAAYTQVNRGPVGRSVRTERWRYTEWGPEGKDGIELYDHSKDPGEYHNLADTPEYSNTLKDLMKLLHQGFTSSN